jgi:hypothetical protein
MIYSSVFLYSLVLRNINELVEKCVLPLCYVLLNVVVITLFREDEGHSSNGAVTSPLARCY